jgi:hypothetical protein
LVDYEPRCRRHDGVSRAGTRQPVPPVVSQCSGQPRYLVLFEWMSAVWWPCPDGTAQTHCRGCRTWGVDLTQAHLPVPCRHGCQTPCLLRHHPHCAEKWVGRQCCCHLCQLGAPPGGSDQCPSVWQWTGQDSAQWMQLQGSFVQWAPASSPRRRDHPQFAWSCFGGSRPVRRA